MKTNYIAGFILAIILVFTQYMITKSSYSGQETNEALKVMSFNIRYNNPSDGPNAWDNRKEMVRDLIIYHNPDLLGIQEGLIGQVAYLEESIDDYTRVGVGRDDGEDEGEFSAIFYREDKFKLLETNTFWLSETPLKPSKSWDAALPRIVTWAKLNYLPEQEIIYYFNTHFDHRGKEARKESARVLAEKIKEISNGSTVLLTGDFNFSEDEPPYSVLMENTNLKDAFHTSENPAYGPEATTNGFEYTYDLDRSRIDYIFVPSSATVLKYATLSDSEHHRFPSDHFPVTAVVKISD